MEIGEYHTRKKVDYRETHFAAEPSWPGYRPAWYSGQVQCMKHNFDEMFQEKSHLSRMPYSIRVMFRL